LDGDPAPLKSGTAPLLFGPCILWATVKWMDGSTMMPLEREVDLSPDDTVLYGYPALPKMHSPQFSDHVCCGQTAGWIKMLLCMEVDLDPGHIVRWGARHTRPPLLCQCLLWQTVAHLRYC